MFEFAAVAIAWLNNSPAAAAIASVLFNYGSRFILSDLTPEQEKIMASRVTRKLLVLCMFFIATRDVMLSIMLTVVFMFFANVLFNENSDLSVFNTILGRRRRRGDDSMPAFEQERDEGVVEEGKEEEKTKEAFEEEQQRPIVVDDGGEGEEYVEEEEEEDVVEASPNPFLDAFSSVDPAHAPPSAE